MIICNDRGLRPDDIKDSMGFNLLYVSFKNCPVSLVFINLIFKCTKICLLWQYKRDPEGQV